MAFKDNLPYLRSVEVNMDKHKRPNNTNAYDCIVCAINTCNLQNNMFWRKKVEEYDGNPCFEKQSGQNTNVDVDLDFANNKMLRFT